MFQAFQFRRLSLLTAVFLLWMAGLECRLFWLQVARHEELSRKAAAFTETRRVLTAWRGEIRERSGATLAVSRPFVTVYGNLPLWTNRLSAVVRTVAPLLDAGEPGLVARLRANLRWPPGSSNVSAIVLQRHVPLESWDLISNAVAQSDFGFSGRKLTRTESALQKRLQRGALFAREEQGRVYPFGTSLAHVTGYVMGAADAAPPKGVFGVEGALDGILAGTAGLCVSEQDAAGREMPFRRREFVPAVNGNHVVLTVDLGIQQIAERALANAVRLHAPKNASVIVVRPRTGEILAWACWPSLGPEAARPGQAADWRNHALSDKHEPGSTFKIFTLAAALDDNQVTLDDSIFCGNGRFVTNRVTVHDHAPYGWLTIRQAVAKSSNVAFAKLAARLGAERLRQYLTRFGFGQRTGVPLISETAGYLPSPEDCSKFATLARMAFGQGLGVSQLQMTMAVAAICNDGRLMRPLLVSQIESPDGRVLRRFQPQFARSVISPRAARQVREALQGVLTAEGTGVAARLKSHTAAGKTGTAQIADRTGYLPGRYYSSFIGFFPADEPEICISVALDEPQNGYYGGTVAAPVFRVIAEQVASYLDIPPDQNALLANSDRSYSGEMERAGVTEPDPDGLALLARPGVTLVKAWP